MDGIACNTTPKETTSAVGHKRTRTGETFIDPSEVTLHCHDFTFEGHCTSLIMPGGDGACARRGFHTSQHHSADGTPSLIDSPLTYYGSIPWTAVDDSRSPAVHTVTELTSFSALHEAYKSACMALLEAAADSEEKRADVCEPTTPPTLSPWEKHYEHTTNTFFPIKNYIHRAFPTLLGSSAELAGHNNNINNTPPSNEASIKVPRRQLIMECGCGNGSAILTFLRHCPENNYICFDISATAVRLLSEHSITKSFLETRMRSETDLDSNACNGITLANVAHNDELVTQGKERIPQPPLCAFVYDICDPTRNLDELFVAQMAAVTCGANIVPSANGAEGKDNNNNNGQEAAGSVASLPSSLPYRRASVDQLLLIFVLCALPSVPSMRTALRRMAYWLRPGAFVGASDGPRHWTGGRLLFRDYAILDHNMLRFLERPVVQGGGQKKAISDAVSVATSPFFSKGDGTSQFFFEKTFTLELFASCGLVPIELNYHCNEVKNRKNGKVMRKVFINGEFGVLDGAVTC